jgi:hypothetical protein
MPYQLSKIIKSTLDIEIIWALVFSTFARVQDLAVMTTLFQMSANESDTNSPTRMGRWI